MTRLMRQSDEKFSSILTKIGNNEALLTDERKFIESRFRTRPAAHWSDRTVSTPRVARRRLGGERFETLAYDETISRRVFFSAVKMCCSWIVDRHNVESISFSTAPTFVSILY